MLDKPSFIYVCNKLKGVDILGKEDKKGKDRKKGEKSKEVRGVRRHNVETDVSLNSVYNEMRRLNRNLEKMGNSTTQNSSNLSNILGNLDLTKIIGILTLINNLRNLNQGQETQSLPNMIQQMLPLLDTGSKNTESK
jgi:hypothetical protein